MSHTDVKAALGSGVAAINAWAAGERAKIAAAHAGHIAADAGVAALSAEFKSLSVEEPLPRRFFGHPVFITNAHGQQLQMSETGELRQHTNKGGWEKWLIEDGGDGRVFITNAAHKGKRIQATDDRKTVRHHTNSGGWEKWRILEAAGGKFMFQSNFGQQLSQDDHGHCSQSPNTAGWEQFTITFADGGSTARKADVERRLHEAQAHAKAAADATAAGQEASLAAEVARRIQVKTDLANRIEAELAGLAAL